MNTWSFGSHHGFTRKMYGILKIKVYIKIGFLVCRCDVLWGDWWNCCVVFLLTPFCYVYSGSGNSQDFWEEGQQGEECSSHQPLLPVLPGKILSLTNQKLLRITHIQYWEKIPSEVWCLIKINNFCQEIVQVIKDTLALWVFAVTSRCFPSNPPACYRRRILTRLIDTLTSPWTLIATTRQHSTTRATQCLPSKTMRRLQSSTKKRWETIPPALRPSTTWVISSSTIQYSGVWCRD